MQVYSMESKFHWWTTISLIDPEILFLGFSCLAVNEFFSEIFMILLHDTIMFPPSHRQSWYCKLPCRWFWHFYVQVILVVTGHSDMVPTNRFLFNIFFIVFSTCLPSTSNFPGSLTLSYIHTFWSRSKSRAFQFQNLADCFVFG